MWFDFLDDNTFLLSLYETVPVLADVKIYKFVISDSGNRITIVFRMPKYSDNPPKKWKERDNNAVMVEVDFFAISELTVSADTNYYTGNIEINKAENQLLDVAIEGKINVRFKAEAGLIQSLEGYIDNPEQNA